MKTPLAIFQQKKNSEICAIQVTRVMDETSDEMHMKFLYVSAVIVER